ncbi:MAG: S-methyl-5'-thioadenosine phosphorylase [Aquifex sp.]|nr:MAG: S-methyl-5'-thioadenosine phosphorylase [Aquifex sp.]
MLGIIGGSGLYKLPGIKVKKELELKTPFGEPSSPVVIAEVEGKEVAFLARHGKKHEYPPHLVPYRANLWALREVGVKRVLGISAVGGINELLMPGDFVVIHDYLDFTKTRKTTYYEGKFSVQVEGEDKVAELLKGKKVVHVDMSEAYCPEMRKLLVEILKEKGFRFHPKGVYACTEGPRFETPSEIKMLKLVGADVVGMTGYPEVALARELTMCYASLCVVANPAAGIAGYRLTSDEVIQLMKKKEEEIREVVLELIKRLPEIRNCDCEKSLEGAEV